MSRFFKTAIDVKISKTSKTRTLHSQSLGHYFKQNPGHKVVMVGGLAAVASLNLRLNKHPDWVEKIIFCSETPWIGKIHPKWVDGEWGQDVNYLPLALRRIAIEQLKLSLNSDLCFGQMQDILSIAYESLEQKGLKVINQRIQNIAQKNHQAEILLDSSGQKKKKITVNGHYVINFARMPSTSFENISVRSTGDLYTRDPLSNISSLIAIEGMGQNALWALRDFGGKCPIWILLSEGEQPRSDLVTSIRQINENTKNPYLKCGILMMSKSIKPSLEADGSKVIITGTDLFTNTHKTLEISTNDLYAARGLELNKDLISGQKILNVETPGYKKDQMMHIDVGQLKQVPYSIVPPGNLAAVHTGIEHVFGSEVINDYRDLGRMDVWKKRVQYHAKQLDYMIDDSFFITLAIQYNIHSTHQVHALHRLERMVAKAFEGHVRNLNNEPVNLSWQEFLQLCGQEDFECTYDQLDCSDDTNSLRLKY